MLVHLHHFKVLFPGGVYRKIGNEQQKGTTYCTGLYKHSRILVGLYQLQNIWFIRRSQCYCCLTGSIRTHRGARSGEGRDGLMGRGANEPTANIQRGRKWIQPPAETERCSRGPRNSHQCGCVFINVFNTLSHAVDET